MIERHATTADETRAFGATVAAALLAPPMRSAQALLSGPAVIDLSGDLGAGKTTFAQGFIARCGVADAVRSPTYALMEPYEAEPFTLLHLDLYRLRDPSELEALGLRDWARPRTVWLVEWPERGERHLPPPDLRIALGIEAGAHRIAVTAASPFGTDWVRHIDLA